MASSDDNRIDTQPRTSWLLSRLDQAAVAVILTLSLAVIVSSVWIRSHRQGGVIDVDQAKRYKIDLLVDINSADWPELSLLPNIGEVLARRIVESRQQDGPFTRHDQLRRVFGIGPRTLEAIRPYLLPLPKAENLSEE